MITWTAKNNSSYLNGRRSANTMRGAVSAARRYLADELYGEGTILYYEGDDDTPIREDEISIHTGMRMVTRKMDPQTGSLR
jgi:hypothetical protein